MVSLRSLTILRSSCANCKVIEIMSNMQYNNELVERLRQFIEEEARACSMEPALITAEYVFRMWGGKVSLEDIEAALKVVRGE